MTIRLTIPVYTCILAFACSHFLGMEITKDMWLMAFGSWIVYGLLDGMFWGIMVSIARRS